MFKIKKNIVPHIKKELFASETSPYNLCNNNSLQKRRAISIWCATESVTYLELEIWDLVPNKINQSETPNVFSFRIKRWVPKGCPWITWKL